MIALYRSHHAVLMPWKNGKGTTRQLLIEPTDANLLTDPFLWRVSSAPISEAGDFSKFPGYHRLLICLSGQGLRLNGILKNQHEVISFSGEDAIFAEPLSEGVIDLGIIFAVNKVQATLIYTELEKGTTIEVKLETLSCEILFLQSGSLKTSEYVLSDHEWLRIDGPETQRLQVVEASRLVRIKINPLTSL